MYPVRGIQWERAWQPDPMVGGGSLSPAAEPSQFSAAFHLRRRPCPGECALLVVWLPVAQRCPPLLLFPTLLTRSWLLDLERFKTQMDGKGGPKQD